MFFLVTFYCDAMLLSRTFSKKCCTNVLDTIQYTVKGGNDMNDYGKAIGERIRNARKKKQITQGLKIKQRCEVECILISAKKSLF